MRFKIPAMLVLLLAVAAVTTLLSGGDSMAWFDDTTTPSTPASFVAGTVEIAITGEEAHPADNEWKEGEPRDFTWTLQNTGTKRVFIRARLEEALHSSKGEETAWGEGQRFVENGNWAMYFPYTVGADYPGGKKRVNFIAGQHHVIGTVEVWEDDENNLVVELHAGSWTMSTIHLAVADDFALIPKNKPGNPQNGRFPFKEELNTPLHNYTFVIPMSGKYPAGGLKGREYSWTEGETLYIAAHADVAGGEVIEAGIIGWVLHEDCSYRWVEHNGYWYYCFEPVMPGEEIEIYLAATPQNTGSYSVKLKAEAVQALPEAAREYWGDDLPCLQSE